jgi:peptidoglycan hydrolase-like protein with peptidoglycan-binding domain
MDYAVSLDALRGGAITKGVSNMAQSTVSMGDSNAYVKQLQSELNALGYSVGTPDGVFGSLTQEGVKSFQSSHGLTSDGVVGPMTWAALSRDSVKPTVKPVTTPVATPTTNPAGTSATLTDAERTQLFEQFVSAMRQLLNVKS